MDDVVAVTLLRHGLTAYNEEKRYVGWTDIPLSNKGRKLLTIQREIERYPTGQLLFTSNLIRCQESSSILYPDMELILISDLCEYHFGLWEGKTYEDLKGNKAYQKWLDAPLLVTPPKGESYNQFQERVIKGWQTIVSNFKNKSIQHIIVISHGGVIRLLLESFSPTRVGFWNWNIQYGAGYTLLGGRQLVRRGDRCTLLQVVPITEKENG